MTIRISGYTDRISVHAGDEISFMLSADFSIETRTELVRLIHGDAHPGGPGLVVEQIPASLNVAAPSPGNMCRVAIS